jgi:hypothetical protein|tara:strand:- start:3238 stop:3546 length:309 start_codon:yes stop_codon:yes gene_type:complete
MIYYTGDTVHINFVSVSGLTNAPVTDGTEFNDVLFKDGAVYNGAEITVSLVDNSLGMYLATFVLTELGDYQLYVKNEATNVIYITETIKVVPREQTTIYVGI